MAATVMELYGSKVFNEHEMRERLPSSTYKSLKAVSYTHLGVYKRQFEYLEPGQDHYQRRQHYDRADSQ